MKFGSKTALVGKLIANKKYRDAYVFEHVKNGIPFQVRALREERGWTQGDLGSASGKPRNVITRLEDPNYGRLTLKTLFEVASAFDVALLVKFIPFSRLVREYEDVSTAALSAASISSETRQLRLWASIRDRAQAREVWAPASVTSQLELSFESGTSTSVSASTVAGQSTGNDAYWPMVAESSGTIDLIIQRPEAA